MVEKLSLSFIKFTKVDKLLKQYQYADALRACMEREDEIIVSLLTELDRRDGLVVALKDHDMGFLMTFAKFLSRYELY